MRLATGHLDKMPYSDNQLHSLRREIFSIISSDNRLLEIPCDQPFYLFALSEFAKALGGPDWEIVAQGNDCFVTGVPVGYNEVIERAPQVFPKKLKGRKLDESIFEWEKSNYAFAELSANDLEIKFREVEGLGRMFPTTIGALRQEYPADRIRIAAMGAIQIADKDVRPLHEGTHGVQVNNGIHLLDQLQCPGRPEIAALVYLAEESKEACFALSADIKAAHRRVKLRRAD